MTKYTVEREQVIYSCDCLSNWKLWLTTTGHQSKNVCSTVYITSLEKGQNSTVSTECVWLSHQCKVKPLKVKDHLYVYIAHFGKDGITLYTLFWNPPFFHLSTISISQEHLFHIYVYMYACMYIGMYGIYTYIYTCIYIHTHTCVCVCVA